MRQFRALVLAVAGACVVLGSPSAGAASRWSPPSQFGLGASTREIAALPDGTTVAILGHGLRRNPPFTGPNRDYVEASVMPPQGVFGSPFTIAGPGHSGAQLVSNFEGDLGALMGTDDGAAVVTRRLGSGFGPVRDAWPDTTAAALNADGRITVLGGDGNKGETWVARPAADGGFGPREEIATGPERRAFPGDIRVARDGTTTVALRSREDEKVYALTAPPGGDFGPLETIASHAFSENTYLDLLEDAHGDDLLVWNGSPEPGLWSYGTVHTSFRPAGGDWGAPARIPDDPLETGAPNIDGAMNDRGDAILAWNAFGTTAVSYRPAGGKWEPATALPTDENRANPSVAIGTNGDAVVVYTVGEAGARLEAIDHPANRGFQRPEPALGPVLYTPPAVTVDSRGEAVMIFGRECGDDVCEATASHQIAPLPPPGDDRPTVSKFRLDAGATAAAVRFASERPPAFSYRLSERGRVRIELLRVVKKRRMTVAAIGVKAKRGANRTKLSKRMRRLLRSHGRYEARIVAIDRHEQYSKPRSLAVK